MGEARQARENRAYVRWLLRGKQPGFAAALEAVVLEWAARDLSCQPAREPPARYGRDRRQRRDDSRPLSRHRRCHGQLANVPYGTGADRRSRRWNHR